MAQVASRRMILGGALGLLVAGPGRAQSSWPGGARAALSLTYDDGLDSQLQYALPDLDRRGLKATFFLTQANMAPRVADWTRVGREGHEIADHTISHPCDLRGFTPERFQSQELGAMETYLDRNFGRSRGGRVFAYPCGYLGLGEGDEGERFARYQRLVRRDFAGARTTAGGPNTVAEVRADAFHLHAIEPTEDGDNIEPARRYLRETMQAGGWAIFVFHSILPARKDEGDTSVAAHQAILDMVMAERDLWCAPMGTVLRRVRG